MKKLIFVFLVLLLTLSACKEVPEVEPPKVEEPVEKPIMVEDVEFPVEINSLSDIQVEACNVAHEAGTCDTRLAELGIVTKEGCCEVMGVCC